MEKDRVKIFWDFVIHINKVMEARKPDIVIVDKLNSQTVIIDIAVPGDFRAIEKEAEAIEKYEDLALELSRMWENFSQSCLYSDWSPWG